MNEALTPSGFMEQYEFIDRKIPVRLIAEMRNRFDALEVEGVGSWKMLCDEVANLDVEKKVNQNRLYVVQACAEVLLEKISTKKSYDDLYWDQRVQQLNSPEEFWQLFALLNVAFEDVFSSAWFRNNGYDRFYKAISEGQRFGVWNNFLEYIGADNIKNSYHVSDRKLINRVVGCKMPDDFIKLFREEGISDDKWHSSHWLQANGYRGLCSAISDIRFDTWSNFLGFMKVEKEIKMADQIEGCKTPDDFIKFFREIGIQGNEWLSSFWLENNGYRRLYRAIVNDARFNSWSTFLEFMSVECDGSWTKRVAVRKTPDDFIKFFKEIGIQGNEWKNSKWLDTNGFPGLRMAITEDIRFESWSAFLAFMDPEAIHEDEEMEQLATLSVEEAVALLGERDPYKLKIFLQFAHPELTEEEIDKLVRRAFKNFVISTQETREEKYLRYEEGLLQVQFHEFPRETEEPTVTITGRVKGEFVYCAGVYTKRTRLEDDGTFSFCIPLKIGETNEVRIMAVNTRDPENPVRSVQRIFTIEQTGEEEDDVESLFALLSQHAREIREGIRQDPGRLEHFEWCAEQVLIKKFSSSFEEGEEYVKELIVKTESGTIRKVLRKTLTKFRKINKMPFPNVQEGSLLFFQKYCVVEILRRMKDESCLGVILANDPGLGKTRTVLAAIAEYEAGIICPNAVVSVWGEEVNEVLENPDMLVMREVPHKVRKEMLRIRRAVHEVMSPARYVTNINFLQKIKDKERFSLLGDKKMVLVHDEAHSRVNEHSEQSKGARMIDHKFQINVTATPAKNPEAVRRLLRTIHPKDKRFKSAVAFRKAFPADNPRALKTLSLILRRDTIRFRKQDVMEEVDPNQSLDEQRHKLPKKEFIKSSTRGDFTMSDRQARSIYKMFLNWHDWTEQYDKFIPDDETTEEDRLRVAGALTKKHALRQSINNPSYVGLNDKDAKSVQTRNIVNDCLKRGRKVIIFCAYNAQAEKYAKMFKKHNPAVYTGTTSMQGEKKDDIENTMRFAREKDANGRKYWKLDANGYPVEDNSGETMSALDYERITFQNADDRQIIIATYKAGAVGTTFTAGKAMIFDDLPTDVVEAIQAEDRNQRIDPDRQTHATVEYYNLISKYPPKFLERMKKIWVVKDIENKCYREFRRKCDAKEYAEEIETNALSNDEEITIQVETAYDAFFAQGTYDEVHTLNLIVQRQVFHLINDGIADSSILSEDQIKFKGFEANGLNTLAV